MHSTKHGRAGISTVLVALASCGLALSTSVAAAQSEPSMRRQTLTAGDVLPEEALGAGLLEWIGEHSSYDVSAILLNPPTVTFCRHGSTLIYEGKAIHFDERLKGVYDEQTEQICLAQPWEASRARDVGVLLHELVHHVQFQSKYWPCPKRAEWEAYKLQEAWLIENGVRPDFNWLGILMSSNCSPRDIHP